MAASAAIFGSAFLWIALALRSFSPGTLASGRVALGAAALALVPAARCVITRVDWPRLVIASLIGMAAPALLFAFAEERIPSALAGMLVSAIPIATALVAAVETRTWPARNRSLGLAIGLGGIILLTAPNVNARGDEAIGVVMVLAAVLAYAIASTLYAPLQQTYGSLRVTMWVLVVSAVALLPLGVLGLPGSSVEPLSATALLVLGVLGTGVVWALFVGLVGRVGAVRASVVGYLIPIVALGLGVTMLDEDIELIQVVGVLVALAGGYLVSRGSHPKPAADDGAPPTELATVRPSVPSGIEMCR
jgi:drug/metabolite transporter (DMT)-like permease